MNTDTYLNEVLTSEDTKVYFPCSLYFKSKLVLKNRFGSKVITKEVINCYDKDRYSHYRMYGEFGISAIKVVVSVSNKVVIAPIELFYDSAEAKTRLGISINDLYYEILSIEGEDPMYFAPHLRMLGIE